jgi:hypothetical protein
MKRERER